MHEVAKETGINRGHEEDRGEHLLSSSVTNGELREEYLLETIRSFLYEVERAPTVDSAMAVLDRSIDQGLFVQGALTSLILRNDVIEYHSRPLAAEHEGLALANELGLTCAPTCVARLDREGLSLRVLQYPESVEHISEFGKADHSKITNEHYSQLRDDLYALVDAGYYHELGSQSSGYWEVADSGTFYLRGFASLRPLREGEEAAAFAAIDTTFKGFIKEPSQQPTSSPEGTLFIFQGETFANMTAFSNAIRFPIGSDERAILALQDPKLAKVMSKTLAEEGLQTAHLQSGNISIKSDEFKKEVMLSAIAAYNLAQGKEPSRKLTEANVVSNSRAYKLVSNFAETEFKMSEAMGRSYGPGVREITFKSVEAFVHYIKCPEGHEGKEQLADLSGVAAKRALDGDVFKDVKNEIREKLARGETPTIYGAGKEIPYRSEEHFNLIKEALRAKFTQNDDARAQLLDTADRTIVHNTGRRESRTTSLPAAEFTRMLTELRDELREQEPSH